MALLPADQRSQVMLLATIGAVALGYAFWNYYYKPASEEIATTKVQIDSLQKVLDDVKRDLAQGTVEDLRAKVEQYRSLVALMRRLVPEKNEVPALIDDFSTKAKVRGVTINRIDPLPVEPGPMFDTYRYRLEIVGHYDQLGEYLSDIASLSRVVVPQDLSVKRASQGAQRLLADTAGQLLEADVALRTFVKAAAPAPARRPPGSAGDAQ
ncbi:MAG TPA: type 4a pilus biogenesis protein PilO [Gemmatimonadales bacterium]|nr:type 4a pilus biogenesis protein PilO [Gemmatimonadales bacterium]